MDNDAAQCEIKIDKKPYSFAFIFADISHTILGMDFLQKFGMTLDLAENRLVHSGTATRFSSAPRVPAVSGVNVVSEFVKTVQQLLAQFPEITDISKATCSLKHDVQCHIRTAGPPRRLTPEKLQIAR